MQSFSKKVSKHKRFLYDLFLTIEDMVIGNSSITSSFKDGCYRYEIRSHTNQPTVLLTYEETTPRKVILRNNKSSMQLKREQLPQTEILPTEQTPDSYIKNVDFNNSNSGKTYQYLEVLSKQDINERRMMYDLFVTIENIIIGASSVTRHVVDRLTICKITSVRPGPSVIILYELPSVSENNNSIMKLNSEQEKNILSENIPFLMKTSFTESNASKMNVTAHGTKQGQEVNKERLHTGKEVHNYYSKHCPNLSEKMSSNRTHTGENLYKFDYCGRKFAHRTDKIRHERQHTGEKPYRCQFCEKTFAHLSEKICHERCHTGEKPYKCQFCEKTFAQSCNKIRHERQHTGEKPYKCQFCEKTFSDSSHKLRHERQHTGEKPFKCQFCEKTFAHISDKICHERCHTGEKPYKCQFCEKTFAHSSNKMRHERQHTGEKPYQCGHYGRKFAHSSDKLQHERQLTGYKPYKCEYCEKTCSII